MQAVLTGRRGAVLAGCLAVSLAAGAGDIALAQEDASHADVVADAVNAVAVPVPGAVSTTPSLQDDGLTAAGANGLEVDLPLSSDDKLSLNSGADARPELSISLPATTTPTSVSLTEDGTAVYGDSGRSADIAIQTFDTGVRVSAVLLDPQAASHLDYEVDVPAGGSLQTLDTGGLLVLAEDGTPLGGFDTPWAKDANGQDLGTRYEISGSTVTQIVDITSDTAFPVVADPYLWRDLIAGARWDLRDGQWVLFVTPTGWARALAGGYLPGVAGWNELYAKYKNVGRGIRHNLDGMRDQYICHQQVVALRAPNRPTWNLDEWRPNVSYVQTVNASCNPGGPRWFD